MPRKLVLADDSRVFRALMSEVLRGNGWEVIEAATGRDAAERILFHRPDLVILDGLMPLLSGFEVLKKVRAAAPDYEPVVFLITAVYKSRRWESEARVDYKVDEYLEKPLEPGDLIAAVQRHFPTV